MLVVVWAGPLGLVHAEPAGRWEKAIAAFEAKDRECPPPKNGVVFVGSSSIRLWDLPQAFPDLPVVNRGFGGSEMGDVLHYAPRIVVPLAPKLVVVYSGDNDIKAGKAPGQVHDDFDALATLIRRELPDTHVWCIGVKPSPARWSLIEKQREANALLKARCEKDPGRMLFLDVESIMLKEDGRPDEMLFAKDKLHLSPAGYDRWNKLMLDALDKRNVLSRP
jgi:lysophospholipase L1-like esterase